MGLESWAGSNDLNTPAGVLLRKLISLLPAAVATWWFTRHLPEITRLCAIVVVMGLWTTHVMARHGLSPTVRGEFLKRVPSRVRPLLSILGFGSLPEKTS